jgi:GNAT superfamily N-acetyltransferase
MGNATGAAHRLQRRQTSEERQMTSEKSEIKIVRVGLEHLDLVASLFDLYRQFYRQVPDLAGAREFIRERLERSESVIFLALEGDRALGFTQLYPLFSSVSMRRLWILNDLYVTAETRQHGVGRALLDRAREFALETGAKGLELATATDNLPAQRLYEKTGWQKDLEFFHYSLNV